MFKFRSEDEVKKLSKKERKHYQKSISECKYKFAPQLYENYPELLFPLIKLEKYYISISCQVPKKQGFKSNNKISVPLENLSNWMQ
ncbi:hypothetical protein C2G38_2194151 [Gigaspora rosea]|uniref:Uncharacterized protein n=1 Tax=Gigaspora rosea TaxID=44941 RepID=A0A397V470_9GLOM|nr:hypothetical protein C2G38_2194151 [Gigaspora rosea]